MEYTIRVRANARQIVEYIHSLPGILSGKDTDEYGVATAGLNQALKKTLELVVQDYHTKSLGGTGEDGVKWDQLAPSTVRKRLGGSKEPEEKTGKQNKAASALERQIYHRLTSGGMTHERATEEAGRQAELANKGYLPTQTSQAVPILVDNGDLIAAISPGSVVGNGASSHYLPPPNQYLSITPGKVEVGTEVLNKSGENIGDFHQSKLPRKQGKKWNGEIGDILPRRNYMPDELPKEWEQEINDEYANGLAAALVDAFKMMAIEPEFTQTPSFTA